MNYLILFADADWIKLATFLVIGTFYVISYLAGKLRDRQVAKNRPPQRPAKANGDAIAGELEEFLKKAQKREQPKKQTPRQEPQPVTAAARNDARKSRRRGEDRGNSNKRRTLAAPLPTLTESRAKDDAQRKSQRGEGVDEHVRHAIDTRKFDQRAAQLGQLEATAQMQSHLQEAFSHQLGTLGPASTPSAMTPATPAAAVAAARSAAPIAAMLSGGNLKQAVVLKEILERPLDRWS